MDGIERPNCKNREIIGSHLTPKQIADAIEQRVGLTGQPAQSRDILEQVFLRDFSLSAAEAAEQSDRHLLKVLREIGQRQSDKEANGEISIVNLRGTQNEIIYGSCHIFPDDNDDIRISKRHRISANKILSAIQSLSFFDFEKFGRKILHEVGCHFAEVTKHSGDQGIDFYGQLTVGSLLGASPAILKLMHDTKLAVIGQAKHYPERTIGPATVRELVGALSLSRTRTFSEDKVDILDGVQVQPFSPILAMLFSTGEFTRGARKLAERAGVIVFSGSQLSVFLADKGVGIIEHNGQTDFDPTTFSRWLE